MRKTLIASGIAAILLLASACSSSDNSVAFDCNYESELDPSIKVSGSFGGVTSLDAAYPIKIAEFKKSKAISGEGELSANFGTPVSFDYSIFNGNTGEVIEQMGTISNNPSALVTLTENQSPVFQESLYCSVAGDRVVTSAIIDDVYGAQNFATVGMNNGDTVILVIDVHEVFQNQASGTTQLAPNGFPQVSFAANGQPGLTLVDADAPKDLNYANLIIGEGEQVVAGDRLIVKYTGWLWGTKPSVFYSTWNSGTHDIVNTQLGASGVPAGLVEALTNATVGSRVLAVIPPEFGFGSNAVPSVPANSTLIFVVDILGKAE